MSNFTIMAVPVKETKIKVGTVSYWQKSIRRLSVFSGYQLGSELTGLNLLKIARIFPIYRGCLADRQANEIERVLRVYGL